MPTNAERAAWAQAALDSYTCHDEDLESRVSDLICDLAHLLDSEDVDVLETIRRGLYHHAAERGGMDEEGILNAEFHPDYANSPHARMWVEKQ